jgi:hypothetical protein
MRPYDGCMSDATTPLTRAKDGMPRGAVTKTVDDYTRDVRRLLERVRRDPSSYSAALDFRTAYPVFPVETPLGDVSVKLLGTAEAVVESPAFSIYGVAYRLFAHVVLEDGTWTRYDGVTGFDRLDCRREHSIIPARRKFDAVVLPAVAAFLNDPAVADAREAAQAVRLTWTLQANHTPNLRDLDNLIAELSEVRATLQATIARAQSDIARIDAQLDVKSAIPVRLVG